MNSTLIWYTARASGLVAWALLAASVLWGLAQTTRMFRASQRARPAWLLDLHRFLGASALVFLAVHITSILLDTYVHFGIIEVLVPFTGTWHPGAVAWGIAAMYLLLAVELTSLLRSRLPRRVWRATHYVTFPLFAVATVHALTAGTDRHLAPMQIGMLAVSALIAGLLVFRIVAHATAREQSAAPLGPTHPRPAQPTQPRSTQPLPAQPRVAQRSPA